MYLHDAQRPEGSGLQQTWPPHLEPRSKLTIHRLLNLLWQELEENRLRPSDAVGIQDRKRRLVFAFEQTAPWDAAELYDRLTLRLPNDAIARSFHYRLATPTRQRLLEILRRRRIGSSLLGRVARSPVEMGRLGQTTCPGGAGMVIHGRVTRRGQGAQGAWAVLMELRNATGQPICTIPSSPQEWGIDDSGYYAIRFQFDATEFPERIVVRYSGSEPGDDLMRVRVQPMRLPRDSVDAVLDALKAAKAARKRPKLRKKIGALLEALRPSPEQVVWGGLVDVDIADGTLDRCLPSEGCSIQRLVPR